MSEWEPPGHGEHDGAFGASFGGSFGEGDVRWWCDRCGTSCLEATTCDCCELAELRAENDRIAELVAENERLKAQVEAVLDIHSKFDVTLFPEHPVYMCLGCYDTEWHECPTVKAVTLDGDA